MADHGYTLFSMKHDAFLRGYKKHLSKEDGRFAIDWVEKGRSTFVREEPLEFMVMHHKAMVECTRELNLEQRERYTAFFATDGGVQALALYTFGATDCGWDNLLIIPTVDGVWERDFSEAFKLDDCGF
jgi:hypothetical protein